MNDHIARAVQVIEGHVSTTLLATDIAQELDAAGLLAAPEHDAAVAARALREAANEVAYAVEWDDAPESVESWLHERADE